MKKLLSLLMMFVMVGTMLIMAPADSYGQSYYVRKVRDANGRVTIVVTATELIWRLELVRAL
jgi:hypothetical protein